MHRRRNVTALIAGAVTVTLLSFLLTLPAGASERLASVVSQAPVSWTPNVSGGRTVGEAEPYCDATFFGAGTLSCESEVYSTAYVNGDVVVAGAFTEACQPGTLSEGLCAPGTQVKRDDIFAYAAGTGLIDPNFVPVLNAGPAWSVLAGRNDTVYVGGAFTTVYGNSHNGLVKLNVNPGVTTGPTADGSVVKGFGGGVNNEARDLALSPDGSALYVGGQFTKVDGLSKFRDRAAVAGLARLNATTGALDDSFAFTLSGSVGGGEPVKVEAMALSPDGSHLAFSGSFLQVDGRSRPRLAIVDTGGTLGATATLSVWTAPILSNKCLSQHDYVRGLDFSPDGTFIVTADTGNRSDRSTPFSVCDAVARFDVNAVNTRWATSTPVEVPPAWINYAGADSFYSVAVAGDVVYAGGHDRWVNNGCGDNAVCEPNAVLVDGLSALDANTGIALAWWHPQTLRGFGTKYLSTFAAGTYDGTNAGLAVGTDVDNIGGAYQSEEALLPLAAVTSDTPGGPIPSGMFNEEDGANTGSPMCIDDAGDSSLSGNPVELSTCDNDAEQNWSEVNGTIEINGLCLDTAAGATASGTPVALNTCDSSTTQHWTPGTGSTLVNTGGTAADGRQICLADTGRSTTSGTQLQIWTCDGATSQVWPLPAAQGPPAPPATGPVYPQELQPKSAGDPSGSQVPCLDDTGNSAAAGNPVQLWTCTGDPEQNWTLEPGGTIQVDGDYCLDSSNGTEAGAVPVVLNPCTGSTTQLWTVGPDYELIDQGATTLNGTPYCLAAPATANGAATELSACREANNQAWRLPAV